MHDPAYHPTRQDAVEIASMPTVERHRFLGRIKTRVIALKTEARSARTVVERNAAAEHCNRLEALADMVALCLAAREPAG